MTIVCFFIFSCSQEHNKSAEINLNLENAIKLEDNYVYREITNINNKEIILEVDDNKGCFFVSFDKNNHKILKLVKKGKGPNEFLFVVFVDNFIGKPLFFDNRKELIFEVDRKNNILNSKKLNIKNGYPVYLDKIDSNTFISTGFFKEGRFGIFNNKGNLIKITGYYPVEDSLIVDNYKIFGTFQSMIKSNPLNRNLIVCLTPLSDFIEIYKYDKSSKTLCRINNLDLREISKYVKTPGVSKDNIIGNMSFCTTGDYIYVLYNKYIGADFFKDNTKLYCNEVRVFDWKGNLVKKYYLEKPAKSIYVYDNELYALGMNDKYNSEIDVYKLDK